VLQYLQEGDTIAAAVAHRACIAGWHMQDCFEPLLLLLLAVHVAV
jgi:hypothetical protein